MPSKQAGSFRIFRLWGIDVFLHWSWFLVAYWQISLDGNRYSSVTWNIVEYLALFLIVTMHEFGHALACRSVGGKADRIVLWPLGGIAFVAPPPRPGPQLWSIAAGPLVNVMLVPILLALVFLSGGFAALGGGQHFSDLQMLATMVCVINALLLAFNLLPIYPLDGGQMLRSLLWFFTSEARSLLIATIIGFIGVAALGAFALWQRQVWLGLMCVFILLRCWNGFAYARRLSAITSAPRREECACPACGKSPPRGQFWTCSKCSSSFDLFETIGTCPKCGTHYTATACLVCGSVNPVESWLRPTPVPPPPPDT